MDSEPSYDRLQVWLDAESTPRFAVSGADSRHKIIKGIPVGTHTVRFEYAKDGSVTRGADIAWVDNIRAADSHGRRFFDTCRDVWTTPTAPWGWTGEGHAGGWVVVEPPPDRALQRPAAQYHQPSSNSWLKRTIQVPTGTTAKLRFNYYVDSEPKDHLFVIVNSHVWHAISGTEQSGTAEVLLSAGSNTITFGYEKDASGDSGLDVASIDNVQLLTGGHIQVLGDFRGSLPFSDWSQGWTSGGSLASYRWQARVKAPHVSGIDAKLSVMRPSIDGIVNSNEYGDRATGISLFRYVNRPPLNISPIGPQSDDSSKLVLAGTDASHELYIVLMAQAATPAAGGESGDIDLYFDKDRNASLAHIGCAQGVTLPAAEDRKIRLTYSIRSSSSPATVTQWKGTCDKSAPWTAASSHEAWPIWAVASESPTEGLVTIEMKVVVSGGQLSSGPLGFGLVARTPYYSRPTKLPYTTAVHLPYVNGGAPQDADVLTWETLAFAPWQFSDAPIDGCCGPGLIY